MNVKEAGKSLKIKKKSYVFKNLKSVNPRCCNIISQCERCALVYSFRHSRDVKTLNECIVR